MGIYRLRLDEGVCVQQVFFRGTESLKCLSDEKGLTRMAYRVGAL